MCRGNGGREYYVTHGISHAARWKDCSHCKGQGYTGTRGTGPDEPHSKTTEFSWGWGLIGAIGGWVVAQDGYFDPTYQWWITGISGWLFGLFWKAILGLFVAGVAIFLIYK